MGYRSKLDILQYMTLDKVVQDCQSGESTGKCGTSQVLISYYKNLSAYSM